MPTDENRKFHSGANMKKGTLLKLQIFQLKLNLNDLESQEHQAHHINHSYGTSRSNYKENVIFMLKNYSVFPIAWWPYV